MRNASLSGEVVCGRAFIVMYDRELRIVLQVEKPCERCAMITIDPVSLKRDPSLLKTVYEKMGLNFGVYASVRKTGRIQVGDRLYLWEG